MFEIDAVAREVACHCTIGRNHGGVRSEADVLKERGGEGLAAAGGDGDDDAGLLGGFERLLVAGADDGGEVGEEGAIHVDGDEADGFGKGFEQGLREGIGKN